MLVISAVALVIKALSTSQGNSIPFLLELHKSTPPVHLQKGALDCAALEVPLKEKKGEIMLTENGMNWFLTN